MSEEKKGSDKKQAANPDIAIKREMGKRTRRSFLVGGAATAAAYGFYRWIDRATPIGQLQTPLRRGEEYNAGLSRALFREQGMAPEYERAAAVSDLRFNGNFGLDTEMKLSTWRLQMIGLENPKQYRQYTDDVDLWEYESADSPDTSGGPPPEQVNSKVAPPSAGGQATGLQAQQAEGKKVEGNKAGEKPPDGQKGKDTDAAPPQSPTSKQTPGVLLTMDDLRALPHREQVTQFKCIEGWSEIVHWGGARFSDLIAAYKPAKINGRDPKYIYMETANGEYFVGLDYISAIHPQTLLVYEMSGKPINKWHGAPLRLCMPLKYGYKQIKQIAKIEYTDRRPKDYWAQLGYDWYAGH